MTNALLRAAKAVVDVWERDKDVLIALDAKYVNAIERALTAHRAEILKRRDGSNYEFPFFADPEGNTCIKRKSDGVFVYVGPADECEMWNAWFGYDADGKDVLDA